MESLRLLREQFTENNTTYTQVEKNSKYVIYQCVDQHGNLYVEIFRYRTHKRTSYSTWTEDRTECYPHDEAFGDWAWCCSSKSQLRNCLSLNFEITGEEADRIIECGFGFKHENT